MSDSFPTESTLFDASIGHRVDSPGWNIANDQPSDLKAFPSSLNPLDISCEESGLQAISTAIHLLERIVKVAIGGEDGDGTKDFFARELGRTRDILE